MKFSEHRTGVLYPRVPTTAAECIDESEFGKDSTGVHTVWPANEVLCDFLSAEQLWVSQAACAIELGAGLGIAGMHAAKNLGVARVILTDYHQLVLEALDASVRKNKLTATAYVEALDWAKADEITQAAPNTLLMGADLAVSARSATALANVVQRLLPADGTFLYAHTERRAIYRAASGEIVREESDTALDALCMALVTRSG
eukprot:CAMPEP_0174747990 /NCGR_PEP_ID=MMETSP1094-20130205/92441_1 /TAXON_ID=156173 /ORGANISM="Chrysochromulina brevifilum, Strain UTEX LB 985" /LENGTH=201 /DNA_ID=CAMNT_0015952949 /DNA_START=98 /DNA_END=700 /DNA_ORIENTATION=-